MEKNNEGMKYANYLSAHPTLNEGYSKSKFDWYASALEDLLPKDRDAEILEIGPGLGEGMRYLVTQLGFTSVTGIDISEEVVSKILESHAMGVHLVADAEDFLLQNQNRFSLIIMYHVLEHFSKDKVVGCLDACYGSLINGGRLVVVVPNVASPIIGVEQQFFDFTHLTAFSPWSIRQVFSWSKFGKCKVENLWPPQVGFFRFLQKILQMFILSLFSLYYKIFSGVERNVLTHSMRVVAERE